MERNLMKKKQLSKAQLWARQRNSMRFRIGGLIANIKGMLESDILTEDEKTDLHCCIHHLEWIPDLWKESNIESKAKFTGEKS